MLVMGFTGCVLQDNSPVTQWLSHDGLGGVLLFDKDLSTGLFGKNLRNQNQIKQLIHQLNRYSANNLLTGSKVPLLVALDYEGGSVDRLSNIDGCMTTMDALSLARVSESVLEEEFSLMAKTMKSLGFNVNFAPVVDLHLNDQGIIGNLKRSFSANPEEVVHIAKKFVDIFAEHGIACAYKHFPGHGSAIGDTHEGFVDVSETFQSRELEPYNSLLKNYEQLVMVMTAHVVNKKLDSQALPATLSHEILTGILRQKMGYDGIIISDDLQMQAIANHYTLEEALSLTINAGADMLIFANQLGNHSAPQLIDTIEQLVLEEKINPQRIDNAFRRVMRLKQQMECLELTQD